MKIDVENIEKILRAQAIPADQITSIISEIEKTVEEEKLDKPERKKNKKQFIGVANGSDVSSTALYLVQTKSDFDHNQVVPTILEVIKEFNQTKKGIKHPVDGVFAAFSGVPKKMFKSRGIEIKTKEPIIIVTDES